MTVPQATSSMSDEPLPDFTRPPVAEVALAVGFQPLAGLRAVQLGRLWDLWRDQYPVLDEQPPLPPAYDQRPGFAVTFGPPPVNRHWFLSDDGDRLVQLQADRLVVNWRQTPGRDYPRYRVLREEFVQRLDEVARFSREGGWGDLRVTDAELTYVNLVVGPAGAAARAGDVLAAVGRTDASVGDEVETRITQTFRTPSSSAPELTVSAGPGADPQGAPVLVVTLVVRGPVEGAGADAAVEVMDAAHERLVRGFSAVTRPTMHELWGRTS